MRVLFVGVEAEGRWPSGRTLPTFQQTDVEILRGLGHDVRVLLWSWRALGFLRKEARWADVVFCWHIGLHAFAASFVARRLACVIGGFEFANIPELGYGNLRNPWMKAVTRWVWRRSDALLYVDSSLSQEASRAFGHPGKAFHIPTGFDPSFWTPGSERRGSLILTAADAPDFQRVRLKGVDRFLEVAQRCPDLEFAVAGNVARVVGGRAGANVSTLGWLEPEPLRDAYRRAAVYCQPSRREGLPNGLCEAMLCGCVPVGTPAGGIPTVIGDAGFVVSGDPESIEAAIRAALSRDDLRERARSRIVAQFPLERRRKALKEVLEQIAG